jgi:hypothetical protein
MKISNLVLAGVLSLSATVATASTVLTPVDGNANFLVSDTFYNSGYQLAIFDDSAAVASGATIGASGLDVKLDGPTVTPFATYYGGIIGFSSFPPYIATNGYGNTLALSGNSDFIVGLSTDGGSTWYADSGAIPGSANTVSLSFNTAETGAFVVDVQLAPVPVPAAAWLFGTGLIGLVGVARRRA